jgi:N-formylglutamate deformylase
MISPSHSIPGVLYRLDPAERTIPLVFDSPHSGVAYPRDFDYSCPLAVLRSAEDTFVDELFGAAPTVGASLIAAHFPRSYIDANRHIADIDQELLEEPWPGPLSPGEKTRLGMGLVRRLAVPGLPVYARKLTITEVSGRIRRYYEPYHAELQSLSDRLHGEFGALWHIDCHSMKSVSNAMASEGAGVERADFVLGDRDGTSCDSAFTRFVADRVAAMGYSVAINDPYKGVEIVRRYGRPPERRHSLQIEVKRALYMDERTLAPNAGYAKLRDDLERLIVSLAGYVRDALLPADRAVDPGGLTT